MIAIDNAALRSLEADLNILGDCPSDGVRLSNSSPHTASKIVSKIWSSSLSPDVCPLSFTREGRNLGEGHSKIIAMPYNSSAHGHRTVDHGDSDKMK